MLVPTMADSQCVANQSKGANYYHMCQGLNSHYFHLIRDKLINPIVGVYIPIIRIPIKGGMTIPNIETFDHGTYINRNESCSTDPRGAIVGA